MLKERKSKFCPGARETIKKYRPIIQMEATVRDAPTNLRDYSAFRAPGSSNKVYLPHESPKIELPQKLGWAEIG